jgi:hypothetical protein
MAITAHLVQLHMRCCVLRPQPLPCLSAQPWMHLMHTQTHAVAVLLSPGCRCLTARQPANMQQEVLAAQLGTCQQHQILAEQVVQQLQKLLQDCSQASAALSMLLAAWSVAGLGSDCCQRKLS